MTYYTSRMLAAQVVRGRGYGELCQVILVLITDFRMFDDDHCHHRFSSWDHEHGIGLTDLEVVHTFELPKLPRESDGTAQWEWLTFVSVRTEELDMTPTTDPALARAVTIVKHFNADEVEQHRQLSHEMWVNDQASRLGAAHREGITEACQCTQRPGPRSVRRRRGEGLGPTRDRGGRTSREAGRDVHRTVEPSGSGPAESRDTAG